MSGPSAAHYLLIDRPRRPVFKPRAVKTITSSIFNANVVFPVAKWRLSPSEGLIPGQSDFKERESLFDAAFKVESFFFCDASLGNLEK